MIGFSILLLLASTVLATVQKPSSCADTYPPSTFAISDLQYLKYLTWHFTTTPNTTQLAFDLVNAAIGISTPCSLQNVEINGKWGDDSNYWYKCSDRSLTLDGKEYPVKTNAHFLWDEWMLSVNQTWDCGERTVKHIASTTLVPTCKETPDTWQYINNCHTPDTQVPAKSQ